MVHDLEIAIGRKDEEIKRLTRAYASGALELPEFAEAVQHSKNAKQALERERRDLLTRVEATGPTDTEIHEMLTMANAIRELAIDLDHATFEERRAIIELWDIRCVLFEENDVQWVEIRGRLSAVPVKKHLQGEDDGGDDEGDPSLRTRKTSPAARLVHL